MRVKVEIDASCTEPEIIIRTSELTDEINVLVQKLTITNQKVLTGFTEDGAELIQMSDIIRIYAADKKVFIQTLANEYMVRLRLYELEERLDQSHFVRISNSEIVNLNAIKKIDLSFTGTIAMTLSNKKTAYVSRRYVSKIKQILGV